MASRCGPILISTGIRQFHFRIQPSTDTPAFTQNQPVPAKNDVFPDIMPLNAYIIGWQKGDAGQRQRETIHDGSVAITSQ